MDPDPDPGGRREQEGEGGVGGSKRNGDTDNTKEKGAA